MGHHYVSFACGLISFLAICGCAAPVSTGGQVHFDVRVLKGRGTSLLSKTWEPHTEFPAMLRNTDVVTRFVVIPRYQEPSEPPFFPAQVATTSSPIITYPKRLRLATWKGKEHLPWDVAPHRSLLYAWVFAPDCWPVFLKEGPTYGYLLNGAILTRWWGLTEVPASIEGEATAICFPQSRGWDDEVAAAAGCLKLDHYIERQDTVPAHVGGTDTLTALAAYPCWLVNAVDQTPSLTDEDRMNVFRMLLRLYEETRPPATGATNGISAQEAWERNKGLLRNRIRASSHVIPD